MLGPALILAAALAATQPPDGEPAATEPVATDAAAEPAAPEPPPTAAPEPPPAAPTAAPTIARKPSAKTGRGMLIAGGVLTGLGVVGRIALEVYWSTAAQIVPDDPFQRWSLKNLAFVTNWNNLMFFGPGLGLLTAGAYRRGRHEAERGEPRDARRLRLVGAGMLGGGLGLLALTRALFIPISSACPTNVCAYTTLETTFWIGAGATFAGAAHLALAAGHRRGATARVRVTPALTPTFAGLALAGRF